MGPQEINTLSECRPWRRICRYKHCTQTRIGYRDMLITARRSEKIVVVLMNQ